MSTEVAQRRWKIRRPDPSIVDQLMSSLNLHSTLARVLVNRGVQTCDEAQLFLKSGIKDLHDPFLLCDMEKAVKRLKQAGKRNEMVLVYGDYDVDGITSSVVMRLILERLGAQVSHYIPDRIEDGYGFNKKILDVVRNAGAALVVSVDCGISGADEAKLLVAEGVDLIILDHHEVPKNGQLPDAVAVIDPKRPDCSYPFKGLAGVGVVAKVAQAVFGSFPSDILDFVALGTIADVVPLRGENRIFVRKGLGHLEKTQNLGLRALMDVAGVSGKSFKPFHVGFVIGPRLNAAGRMGSAHLALDLLLSTDRNQAEKLAKELNRINNERQALQRRMIEEAVLLVNRTVNFSDERVIVVGHQGWHKGVLGIVASRLSDEFYRPAIVACLEDSDASASARSIEGFCLQDALAHCSDILTDFGGHRMAAGLNLETKNLDALRLRINDYARERLLPEALTPVLEIDAEVDFKEWSVTAISRLEKLEPFGEGNRSPMFCSRNLTVKSRAAVLARGTLKFWVSDGVKTFSAVGFGMADYLDRVPVGAKIDLAYEVGIDDWNKAPAVQLIFKDIRPAD